MAEKTSDTDRLASAFETLAAQMLANTPKPQLGFGDPEYQQSLKDRGYYRQFAKPVYQNNHMASAECLPEEVIAKVNALKSGRYLGGRVTVRAEEKFIQLLYASSTPDDRMTNQMLFRDFTELIDKLTAEAALPTPA